jgi:sugar phosphate permease
VQPSLFVFILFYGLDWVATVPPTVALCRQHFGAERAGVVFGWFFASHMVGAGVAASYAGWIRTASGDYLVAWLTAGAMCLVASALCLLVPRRPVGGGHELGEPVTDSM